jgi:hypothetical protein
MRLLRLPRLFRTNVFRLTLAYMALFALSVGALSAFVYSATIGYLDTQTNAIIQAEINGLYEQYERLSLGGLRRERGYCRSRAQRRTGQKKITTACIGVAHGFSCSSRCVEGGRPRSANKLDKLPLALTSGKRLRLHIHVFDLLLGGCADGS